MMSRLLMGCAALVLATFIKPVRAYAAPTKDQCVDADTQAQNLRRDDKLIDARLSLLVCADEACPKIVRADCTKRLDDLEVIMPHIVFEAKDGAGRDLSAVTVTVDGKPLADHLDGSAIEVDPGEHTFTFASTDLTPTTLKLIIREGDRGRRESISIGTPAAPVGKPPQPAAISQPLVSAPPAEERQSSPSTQKIIALTAAGVGGAGLIVGAVFGALAISKKSDARKICSGTCDDQRGADAWSSAKSAGNVSTVAFIVGGVGLASGAVLWFTTKRNNSEASGDLGVRIGMGAGTMQLKGSW